MQTKERYREYNRTYQRLYRARKGHYYQSHPGYASIYQRKHKYDITDTEYQTMFRVQCGKCAICQEILTESKLTHVDHDHLTKRVRGLLCHRCNRGMGLLGDSLDILKAAVNYLGEQPNG